MTSQATGAKTNVEESWQSANLNKDKIIKNVNCETKSSKQKKHKNTIISSHLDSIIFKKKAPPRVRWAQSDVRIAFKIYLTQVEKYDIDIQDNCLEFSAQFDKHSEFQFTLPLYSDITQKSYCTRLKRYILLEVEKATSKSKWPQLTANLNDTPNWIEYCGESYDRWHADSSDDSSDDELIKGKQLYQELQQQLDQADSRKKQSVKLRPSAGDNDKEIKNKPENNIDSNNSIPNLFGKCTNNAKQSINTNNMKHDYRREAIPMDTSKNTVRHALDYKKTYLFLYNLVMFVMFLMVYIILLIKGFSGTMDDESLIGAAKLVRILTYTQIIESIHPMLGLVPGGPMMPLLQVFGRLVVNHFLTEPYIRVNSAPFAHYLFIVWTSIEIFRYSFYALRVFKVNIYPLTWCRYSLFLPLYPMGGFCESMVVFAAIKFYEKTGAFSVSLPNAANISFNLPIALRIYTYLLLGPSIYYLMRYMWSQRCKQLKEKVA